MFPIRDHNPSNGVPYVCYGLITANVVIYFLTYSSFADPHFLADWTLIPVLSSPPTYVTSQFLHGSLLHLGGNLLFLWIFGDNLEDRMGKFRFLAFYLASGVAAGLAQTLADPESTVPMVGASGAIAGVMGGYVLLFPRARVDILLIFVIFFKIVPIPAWIVLGAWFALQVGAGAMTPIEGGGVAYWAHAGGFLAGIALTLPLFFRLGGRSFWSRTGGRPPHPEARYVTRRSPIPHAGRRR